MTPQKNPVSSILCLCASALPFSLSPDLLSSVFSSLSKKQILVCNFLGRSSNEGEASSNEGEASSNEGEASSNEGEASSKEGEASSKKVGRSSKKGDL
jgi:hypothetical protein